MASDNPLDAMNTSINENVIQLIFESNLSDSAIQESVRVSIIYKKMTVKRYLETIFLASCVLSAVRIRWPALLGRAGLEAGSCAAVRSARELSLETTL